MSEAKLPPDVIFVDDKRREFPGVNWKDYSDALQRIKACELRMDIMERSQSDLSQRKFTGKMSIVNATICAILGALAITAIDVIRSYYNDGGESKSTESPQPPPPPAEQINTPHGPQSE